MPTTKINGHAPASGANGMSAAGFQVGIAAADPSAPPCWPRTRGCCGRVAGLLPTNFCMIAFAVEGSRAQTTCRRLLRRRSRGQSSMRSVRLWPHSAGELLGPLMPRQVHAPGPSRSGCRFQVLSLPASRYVHRACASAALAVGRDMLAA